MPGQHPIPKVFHRIWLGGKPLPDEHARWGKTWQTHHPDWEMKLWTEENLPPLPFTRAYYERTPLLSGKADLVRLELVYALGGVYLDTDFECLRPIDALLEDVDAFACYSNGTERICPALFGACARHPWVLHLLQEVSDWWDADNLVSCLVDAFTALTPLFPQVKVMPQHYFWPVTWTDRHLLARMTRFPGSYGIHRFNGSWMKTQAEQP